MFQISQLKDAFVAAGKKVLAPSVKVLRTFGTISATDASFYGRRTGETGEYILLRDVATGEMLIVGLAPGTPESANAFKIELLQQAEDYVVDGKVLVAKDTMYFKAYGVIMEAE